ncbi:amino acid adenylation domain-containing protein [Pedobacter sp. KACC 23697]|uniref:Amino acid adenylation domain-containing protein n=1 Tax=Pedobacter sp. KACC 23697 TaxID=3149230 RepID=A0AAU7K8E7_9SPHI
MKKLLKDIKDNHILLEVIDGKLQVFTDNADLDTTLIDRIRAHKEELIRFLMLHDQSGFDQSFTTEIPSVQLQENYPVSSAQRRLWIVSQSEQGNVAYNIPAVCVFEGKLNLVALEESFDKLIRRHEILRTVFKEDEEGEIRQLILEPESLDFQLRKYDLRQVENNDLQVIQLLKEEYRIPFDLSNGPLLRAKLIQKSTHQWVFIYTMHHIVSDGWSMNVLIRELLQFYNAYIKGISNPLAELSIQYKDYTAWQHNQLNGITYQGLKSYWLKQFEGDLPVLDLPADRIRPNVRSYQGSVVHHVIKPDLIQNLKHIVQAQDSTLFMGLLAIVNLLIYKYTNGLDLIIGSPMAGRGHLALEDQIGFYINMVALRTSFKETDNYKELLLHVKKATLAAQQNQLYPFDELIEELALDRDMSRNALFDIVVVLQEAEIDFEEEGKHLDQLKISKYEYAEENNTSKYDLVFNFTQEGAEVHLRVEYNSDIFEKSRMVRLCKHFDGLFESVINKPDQPINQLTYLNAEEKQILLENFNHTVSEYPCNKTITDLFEEQVSRTPLASAFVHDQQIFTYQTLNEIANQFAGYLRHNYKIEPDDLIGIKLERTGWMAIAILGILKSGAAYIPIDPEYPQDRIDFMLADSRCKVLIDETALNTFTAEQNQYTQDNLPSINGASDLAYVIYTSGSTGQPKGVLVEHKSLVNLCYWHIDAFSVMATDRATLYAGVAFDAAVWEFFPYIISGASVYVVPAQKRLNVNDIADYYNENKITISFLPTQVAEQFMFSKNQSLRILLTGGEKLNSFKECSYQLFNNYGPTENTVVTTSYNVTASSANIPIGRPIANTQIFILDSQLNLMPVGAIGEICISGDSLARGYLNNPGLTAEKFVLNPHKNNERMYLTGDLGRWTADGNIEFLGRKDDQVKIRGYRIELGEIESCLQSYADVSSSIVIAGETESGESELIAYFTSNETIDLSVLKSYLSRFLPVYMLPHHFIQLESLPLNHNGKINKRLLPRPDNRVTYAGIEYLAPRYPTEEKLVSIWENILNKGKIGVKDNFFDLGGHSLKITRLSSLIYKEFGIKIPVNELFGKVVLEEQASLINEWQKTSFKGIKPVPLQNSYPLSSAQQRLWTSSQLEEGNITFNMQGLATFEGDLNIAALDAAFNLLVERHEVLRTVFKEDENGEIKQFVNPKAIFKTVVEDLRKAADPNDLLRTLIIDDLNKTFNLSTGPLIRASLFQLETDKWIFVYTIHHIVSDGWSMQILIKELLLLYKASVNNRSNPLTPLKIQYKDYAVWQQAQKDDESFLADKNYWLTQFRGILPVLQFPGDKIRPAVKRYRGAMVNKTIGPDVTSGLKTLGKENGATLFMSLFTAVNILLYRYTNQTDLILGSPVAGRTHIDLEDQIGFYINTLALRTKFSSGDSYLELLSNVKQVCIDAYEHQSYPFDELVNQLHVKSDMSRNAVFDVMILLQNMDTFHISRFKEYLNDDLKIEAYRDGEHIVSKYDITFYFTEVGDEIVTNIEYNLDIFNRETIIRLGEYLERLLLSIITSPVSTIDAIVVSGLKDQYLPVTTAKSLTGQLYPSEHQKRLWFIDQFEKDYLYEGSPVYHNLPLIEKVARETDLALLEYKIQETANKHAILRTRISTVQSEPFQVMDYDGFKGLSLHEFNHNVEEPDLISKCVEIINRPFDIAHEQLIRFDLIRPHSGEYIFIITAHHLIADRRSIQLLFNEIMNHGDVAEKQPLSYADYSVWQNNLSVRDLESTVYYWNKKLTNASILYFDPDILRPHIHIYQSALEVQELSAGLLTKLNRFCTENGTSPFLFLLTAFNTLLYRYTGSNELVIGTLYENRAEELFTDIIGPVANLLTLKTNISADMCFMDVLEVVTSDYQKSVEAAILPFEKVVEEVKPGKDMSRTALFDIMIHYEESRLGLENDNGIQRIELNQGLGKYDLNLLLKKGDKMEFFLTYNVEYFNSSRIRKLLTHYIHIIESALTVPEIAIADINYLSKAEELEWLESFNNQKVDYPKDKTIVDLFEEQVKLSPDRIAVVCNDIELTYRELNERSNVLGHYLREHYHVKPDDLIAIKLERSELMIVAILGVLKSGGAYVPIDPDYPEERISFMLSDSACKVVLDEYTLKEFNEKSILYNKDNLQRVNQPHDLAYVIYTSGTTGRPKGALIEHNNLVRLFKNEGRLFDFGVDDTWTMFHSYCFDFSVWEMYGALLFGGKLVIVPALIAKDPVAYLELLKHQEVTVLNQTPSSFYNLIKQEFENPVATLKLRYIIFGGEALSPGKLSAWKERYPATRLINMYGITETTVHVTYKEIGVQEIMENISNIGKPIPTLNGYILDQHQKLMPVGYWGELYVGGEGVCRGYLNREALTSERFISGIFKSSERLYRTGDKVRMLANGEMEYGGRIDDQVKIRGYRIEVGEIEQALEGHPQIDSSVVVAIDGVSGDKELAAYLVSSVALQLVDIRSYLSDLLPAYMLPGYFIPLAVLPLTANGKVDKKRLPPVDGAGLSSGRVYVAPRNHTEEKLAAIWSGVLSRDEIGVLDSFFELGGHSLKATRLASQIYKEFGVKLGLKDLFAKPVLEEQALLISESQAISFLPLVPVEVQASYALSSAQRRLWVLSQFSEGSVAYNMPAVYVFEGFLDVDGLSYAFGELIGRHEVLRTVFREEASGEVRQVVLSPSELGFRISLADLSAAVPSESAVASALRSEQALAFDLSTGPLLRASLYDLGGGRYVFTYTLHHIISDGWSMDILLRELLGHYDGYVKGTRLSLPPLRIQYKDYASWQQGQLSGGSLDGHRSYWLDVFSGDLPVLELPSDRPRPVVKTYNGGFVRRHIGASTLRGLKGLLLDEGSTLFMGLLAALNVLFYRYSGQDDMVIGSPIAGREHVDLEDQLGFYVNTLALRSRFKGSDSYLSVLSMVRSVTLGAYDHQSYPFDELIDSLSLERDMGRSPLFDVLLVLQNTDGLAGIEAVEGGDLQVRAYSGGEHLISKFDLSFYFTENGSGLDLGIEYNSDLYDRSTVCRLGAHLEQLLCSVVAAPMESVCKLVYLPELEREKLLFDFNATAFDVPLSGSVVDLFITQAEKTPDSPALVFGGVALSYGELDGLSNRLGHYLRDVHGLSRGVFAGVCLERNEWLVIATLAVLKIGCCCVPIDVDYPADRISYILEDSGCSLKIDGGLVDAFIAVSDTFSVGALGGQTEAEAPAYVIYTSGSSGRPKGCVLLHGGVLNHLYSKDDLLCGLGGGALCHNSALHFVGGLWQFWYPLVHGGLLVLCSNEELRDIYQLLAKVSVYGCRVLEVIPSQLQEYLLHEEYLPLPGVDYLILTGEPLSAQLVGRCYAGNPGLKVVNTYGQTESSDVTVSYQVPVPGEGCSYRIPAGYPIRNTQVYILSGEDQLCAYGVIGEVCSSGAGLCGGYINDPLQQASRFVPHPFMEGRLMYRTGDLGYRDVDGLIWIVGRKDEQVKIRGYRIETLEIEQALLGYAGIEDAVVLYSDEGGEGKLCAYLASSCPLDGSGLHSHLLGLLPVYMLPSRYVVLERFPLLPNGKTDKKSLKGLGVELVSGSVYVAPRNPTESGLVEIWQMVLGREGIGVKDNFFELGGHSLKATTMVNKIKQDFNVSITLKDVFQYPDIHSLSELIRKIAWVQKSRAFNHDAEASREIIKL